LSSRPSSGGPYGRVQLAPADELQALANELRDNIAGEYREYAEALATERGRLLQERRGLAEERGALETIRAQVQRVATNEDRSFQQHRAELERARLSLESGATQAAVALGNERRLLEQEARTLVEAQAEAGDRFRREHAAMVSQAAGVERIRAELSGYRAQLEHEARQESLALANQAEVAQRWFASLGEERTRLEHVQARMEERIAQRESAVERRWAAEIAEMSSRSEMAVSVRHSDAHGQADERFDEVLVALGDLRFRLDGVSSDVNDIRGEMRSMDRRLTTEGETLSATHRATAGGVRTAEGHIRALRHTAEGPRVGHGSRRTPMGMDRVE